MQFLDHRRIVLFALAMLATFATAASCTPKEPTSILVEMNTDFSWPDEAASIRARITGDNGQNETERFELGWDFGQVDLPNSFAIVPDGDVSSVQIELSLLTAAEDMLVRRTTQTKFRSGKTVRVRLFLGKDCAAIWQNCADGESCSEGQCVSFDEDGDSVHRSDAATASLDATEPGPGEDGGSGLLSDAGGEPQRDGAVLAHDATSRDGGRHEEDAGHETPDAGHDSGPACTPDCTDRECGDDGCGGTCGSCGRNPTTGTDYECDERYGICCIPNGARCNAYLEGCNCCPGLFCYNWICQAGTGC